MQVDGDEEGRGRMNVYRCPPLILPSLRDAMADFRALYLELVPDPIDRGFLPCRDLPKRHPVLSDALDDLTRETMTRQRAERIPCPRFACGPPVCYVPPFATSLHGSGRSVGQ